MDWGVWRVLDMVQRICEEGIDNRVSQQRGDVLNIQSDGLPENAAQYPVNNRNRSQGASGILSTTMQLGPVE